MSPTPARQAPRGEVSSPGPILAIMGYSSPRRRAAAAVPGSGDKPSDGMAV
jgi:hypothetical protein